MANEAIDLSEYKSAHGAAKATATKIKEIAEEMDQDPDLEVTVEKRDGKWIVSWPGGPFDWAVVLTGGESLFAGEMPEIRQHSNEPQIEGFRNDQGWTVECENRSKLGFYSR